MQHTISFQTTLTPGTHPQESSANATLRLSIYLSIYLYIYLSIYLSLSLYIYIYSYWFIKLFVCLIVCIDETSRNTILNVLFKRFGVPGASGLEVETLNPNIRSAIYYLALNPIHL